MFRLILMVLLASLSFLVTPAQTNKKIRSLQREQTALKKDIANQEQLLRSTKKDINSQLANLQVISAQIEGQQKYIKGIHSEITVLNSEITVLEKQLQQLEKNLADCKHKYQRAVAYMFRNRVGISKWQFILSAKNFRQMYRRMRYMTDFSKYQVAQGEIIKKKEKLVQTKRDELLGAKTVKDKLYAEGKQEEKVLQTKQHERQQVVNGLNQKQKQLQSSIAQQRRKSARLNARIDKLIKQEIAAAERRRKLEAERRRKAELARQKRRKSKSNLRNKNKRGADNYNERTATPNFNEADNVDRVLSNNFASNRGRLPIPITGSYAITGHYGRYNVAGLHGVQLENNGINITGRSGAQARSVFKGEVTAIFSSDGMYNIIVRHGSYMSIYCNLSSISVRKGQDVSTGQSLGSVARDASGNCTLLFQLYKERTRLNPEPWLRR